jgi:hypothetical protein
VPAALLAAAATLGGSAVGDPATACAEPKKWNEKGYEACAVQAEKDWRSGSIEYKTFRELVEGCCHLSEGKWTPDPNNFMPASRRTANQ